jgi:hypothetical protein
MFWNAAFKFGPPLEFQYVCVDSARLADFYAFIGELNSKVPGEFLAFFARFQHAFNIFDISFKLHGGWIVGWKLTATEAMLKDVKSSFKIDDYDFMNEVTLIDKAAACPNPCLTDRFGTGCYCEGSVYTDFDMICALSSCNFFTGTDPTGAGCYCDAADSIPKYTCDIPECMAD